METWIVMKSVNKIYFYSLCLCLLFISHDFQNFELSVFWIWASFSANLILIISIYDKCFLLPWRISDIYSEMSEIKSILKLWKSIHIVWFSLMSQLNIKKYAKKLNLPWRELYKEIREKYITFSAGMLVLISYCSIWWCQNVGKISDFWDWIMFWRIKKIIFSTCFPEAVLLTF